MNSFVDKVVKAFSGRSVGFYLNAGAAGLSIVAGFYYMAVHLGSHFDLIVFILPLIGALAFLGASIFGAEKYGAVAMWLCNIAAFGFFGVGDVYDEFNAFFVNLDVGEALPTFISTGLLLISWIYSFTVSFFVKNSFEEEKTGEEATV